MRLRQVLALLIFILGPRSIQAYGQVVSTWNGGTGNWSNPLNWDSGVPNGNYNALITPPASTVNLDLSPTVANLTLGSGNTLNILDGSTLTFVSPGGSTIDNSGNISIAPTGGIVVGAGNTLTFQGAGTIDLNGGSITGATGTESLTMGNTVRGYGTISGLGFRGGSIVADGGTLIIEPNSQGFSAGSLDVSSNSTLDITGGPFKEFDASTGILSLPTGYFQGTLEFDNANITQFSGGLTLDGSGARIINQFGQNALANLSLMAGGQSNSLTIQNGAALTTNVGLFVYAFSDLNILNGSSLSIGGNLKSQGEVTVSSSALTINGDVLLCCADVESTTDFSNSAVNVKGSFTVSQIELNVLNVAGSSVTVGGDFNDFGGGGFPSGYGGLVTISSGGTLNVGGNLTNTATQPLSFSEGSTFTVQKIMNNSGPLSLATGSAGFVRGTLNNSGTIQIDKTSVLSVNSGYSQTAGSTLVDGLLNVGGTGVNIQGGSLGGGGIINGNVLMAGILISGDSPGTLTINGNYNQTSLGSLVEELAGVNPGEFDLLQISGEASLDGALNINLLGGFAPKAGDAFEIMTFGSRDGKFSTVNGLDLGDGLQFDLLYDPHDLKLVVETPEPSSLVLLGISLIASLSALAFSRRRDLFRLLGPGAKLDRRSLEV